MTDSYRANLLRRLTGVAGEQMPVQQVARSAAQETAARIAQVLSPGAAGATTGFNQGSYNALFNARPPYGNQQFPQGAQYPQQGPPTPTASPYTVDVNAPQTDNTMPGATPVTPQDARHGQQVQNRFNAMETAPGAAINTGVSPLSPYLVGGSPGENRTGSPINQPVANVPELPTDPSTWNTEAPQSVPQWQDIKFFEENTNLPDDRVSTEGIAPGSDSVEVVRFQQKFKRDWDTNYQHFIDQGFDDQRATALADQLLWEQNQEFVTGRENTSDTSLPSWKQIAYLAMSAIDQTRVAAVTEMGQGAYAVASGEAKQWDPGWAVITPANWMIQIPGTDVQFDSTRFNQDFQAWVEDPNNWQRIRYAYEHGFQASPTDPYFTGGHAVWELFINSGGGWYKFLADFVNDPAVLAPIGKNIGDDLIEAAIRAAPDQGIAKVATKRLLGEALSTPQNLLDVTVDAPFNFLGKMVSKGFNKVGSTLLQEPLERQAEHQVDEITRAQAQQDRIRTEGIGLDDTPPEEPGGGGVGLEPPPDPNRPRYRKEERNGKWVILDPEGNEVETFPFKQAIRGNPEPNKLARDAQRRVNELNQPIIRAEDESYGAILPPEDSGLTWTSPEYQRLTNKGRNDPMTIQEVVSYSSDLDPTLRQGWLDDFVPAALEHERVMGDFTSSEKQLMRENPGMVEIERFVQGQTQWLYPAKVFEMIRFYVDDLLTTFRETFPGESPGTRAWITEPELILKNGKISAENKTVTLIEHAIFGSRDDAIRARSILRARNASLPGFKVDRNGNEFVDRIAQIGETVNGSGWRSTSDAAIETRKYRAQRKAEGPVDAAAVNEVVGRSPRKTNPKQVMAETGLPYQEAVAETKRRNLEATGSASSRTDPEAAAAEQELIDKPAEDFAKTTKQLPESAPDDLIAKAVSDPTTKTITPNKNRIDAKTPGEVIVKSPESSGAPKKVRIRKTPEAVEVIARESDPPVEVETMAEAIDVADEVLARNAKGIEPTPAQVERVVEQVAPDSAKRKGGPRRPEEVVDLSLSEKAIANQIIDGKTRSRTPEGNRIEAAHRTSRTNFVVSPVQSKNRRYIQVTKEKPYGRESSNLNWKVWDQGLPVFVETLADAIRMADNNLRNLGDQLPLGIVDPQTAKNITNEPRVREHILKTYGAFEGPGVNAEADRIARTDTSYVGAAYQMGEIDAKTYLTLNKWVVWNGQEMRLWEAYDMALDWLPDPDQAKFVIAKLGVDTDLAEAVKIGKIKVEERAKFQRAAYKALAAYQGVLNFQRQAIMFNWARGFGGVFSDFVGTNYSMGIHMEFGAVARNVNPLGFVPSGVQRFVLDAIGKKNTNPLGSARHFIQDQRGKELVIDALPDMDYFRHLTGGDPDKSWLKMIDTRFEDGHGPMILEKTGKAYNFFRPIADRDIKAFRTGMDNNSRYSLGMSSFRKNIRREQNRFRGVVATRAKATGNDYVDWLAKLDRAGNGYNPSDVMEMFGDQRLARDWREMISRSKVEANKTVDKILFSYRSTNLDNKLKNVIFFHYWMTRAFPMHAKVAFKNPWLLNAYGRAWEHMQREAEQNGYPPSVRGFVRMMGDEAGFYGLINPIQVLVPFGMLIENNDDPGVFAFIKRWGFFINPMIEAGAAALGWTNGVPDLTATLALRRAFRYTVNWLNSNEIAGVNGSSLVPDSIGDPNTWQSSILDETEYNMVRWINEKAKNVADYLAPSQDVIQEFDGTSRNAYESDILNSILINELEKTYGSFESWGADSPAWDEFAQARDDIAMGRDGNVLADSAVEIMADAKMENTIISLGFPGGVYQRYGPRDETLREKREGSDSADDQRSLAIGAAIGKGGSDLTVEIQQLERLGTEDGRKGYELWNEIAFGDVEDNDALTLNGQTIRGWQLEGMTDDQRKELADQWLAQYEGVPEQMEAYKALRKDFIAANPTAGDFKEYQNGVGGMEEQPGGIKKWRTDYAKGDDAFAKAMARREEELRGQGKTGYVLDKELDKWALSPEAYNAANGYRDTVYDASTKQKTPDYGFASEDESTSTGAKNTKSKDPMTKLADDITEYQTELNAALTAMRAAGYSVSEADVYSMNPFYATIFKNFGVPTASADVMLFIQWSSLPENANKTVDDFINYLEDLGYKKAA